MDALHNLLALNMHSYERSNCSATLPFLLKCSESKDLRQLNKSPKELHLL